MKNNKALQILIKILVSSVFLLLILYKIDFRELYRSIVSANYSYFFVGVILVVLGLLISTARWQVILGGYKLQLNFRKLFSLYWSGSFLNLFLPTSFGGDIYKYLYLDKEYSKGKKAQIVSSILLDRGIGMYSSIIVASIAFSISDIDINPLFRIASAMFALVLAIIVYFWQNGNLDKLFPNKKLNQKSKFFKTLSVFLNYRNHKEVLLTMLISMVFSVICSLAIFVSFLAVGHKIDFIVLLYTVPLINLTKLIPFTIDSVGVKESFGVYVYSLYGISSELSLSALIFSRGFNLCASLIGGIIFLFNKEASDASRELS